MSERDRRDREARRKAIHDEAEDARREDGGGGFQGTRFLVSDEQMEKLGIRRYTLDSGEDNKGKTHQWSLLEPKLGDPEVIALGLFVHWDVGTDRSVYLCPREMKRWLERRGMAVPETIRTGACPICEESDRLVDRYKREKDDMSEDERKRAYEPIRRLRCHNGSFTDPKPNRFLAWVVDEKDLDAGVQLAEMPQKVYLGLINQADDADTGETLDVLDPTKDGWVYSFKRSGKGQEGTTYDAFKLRPRREAMDQEWQEAVPSFWDVIRLYTYDEIKAAFLAIGPGDSDDDPPKDRERWPEAAGDPPRRARTPVEDGEQAKGDLTDHYAKGEPRRRGRGDTEEDQPRRRRSVDAEEDTERGHADRGAEPDGSGEDAEPTAEAKALAERIRNRKRAREE